MQNSKESVHISPSEWRWVILFSGALVLLAFIPFLWVAITGASGTGMQFMGIFNNPFDGATYLSKMQQGYEGSWLIYFRHTSEQHSPVFIQVLYPLLGHIARLISIPTIALFHVARVVASLIMYMALYHFGATIWPRQRARRIFFTVVAVGSGLGWIGILFGIESPDLTIPEIYPFYSSLVNVHFPFTLACIAFIASVLISAFRPGNNYVPSLNNGGGAVALLTFVLSLLYPQAIVPLAGAVTLYALIHGLRQRVFPLRELRWLLLLILPALPMAAYYAAVLNYNLTAMEWNRQNVTLSPAFWLLLVGLGVPLLMAIPGIVRALRRFEQDGDQFMIIWFIVMLVAMYMPTNYQRRFAVGMMIPIAYFVTRALEGYWFNFVNRRWRYRLLMAVVPTITMSYLLVLLSNLSITVGPFLERDYVAAFQWLKQHPQTDEVILASPDVSVWIPGWVGARVVYGHPFETMNAVEKELQVISWYSAQNDADCKALIDQFSVKYVIIGPQETAIGATKCTDILDPVFNYGSVTVYAP
ncbi:MAG: hypothetical protein R3E39_05415 [Anaerolineae bacterium]